MSQSGTLPGQVQPKHSGNAHLSSPLPAKAPPTSITTPTSSTIAVVVVATSIAAASSSRRPETSVIAPVAVVVIRLYVWLPCELDDISVPPAIHPATAPPAPIAQGTLPPDTRALSPKKSTAAPKNLRSTKSTSALKNAAATKTTAAIAFKATKITKWSEKKKKESEGLVSEVVQVEVEQKTEVNAVEENPVAAEKAENESSAKPRNVPATPGKKRGIEDDQEASVVKRTRIYDPAAPVTPSKRKARSSTTTTTVPLDALVVSSSSLSSSITSEASTAITEPNEEDQENLAGSPALPKRIVRLITIHSSLISLLLMHYATHSHSQPAVLSGYLTQISRNAGTNVSLIDLQRIITLSQKTIRLINVDGRGNAVELVNGVSGNISKLGPEFKQYVEKWWKQKTSRGPADEDEILKEIELAPITVESAPCDTLTPPVTPSKPIKPVSASLSKGQRRLLDLKSFTLTKQTSLSPSPVKKENIISPSKSPSVANRNASLLERIRAKAAATKSAPAAPSPEVMQRRAALQWLESIIPILLQLTTPSSTGILGNTKKPKLSVPSTTSFPMATVVQNVKTSLQKPISTEEVERSLRVLADEVASEFVKIVEWKGDSTGSPLVGVIFDRNGRHTVENWKYVEEDAV
ncbi:hypothetical protein H072_1324 [Dactylellina haptotyla CBS 200.50]|uniref:DNA replication factor Cdt1 C-terminal domain-containing protein n=1 Tax=Dactylellina haptotyla (strain CBS 200.50) TaxID=1284197 RepID=S8AUP0_DACHA|nr:hypothetical protein H072_1324 [Dactylellina haptotyla CBS 200.50]